MADDLQANLQSYVLQLQQVEAALTIDPDNQELQKLKNDLEEVLTLTKDLIKQQLIESGKSFPGGSGDPSALLSDQDILTSIPKNPFKVGDRCMVMSSDDGQFYEGIIEDISEDQEQVTVKIEQTGQIEISAPSLLRPIPKPNVKKKSEQDHKHKKQTQSQREYQKKKKLKKQLRYKQLEEERETEKNKWLAFTSKKKGGLLTKKSIFASPDSVTGRVGIGTCGVSGLPMTEFSHAEKRRKVVHFGTHPKPGEGTNEAVVRATPLTKRGAHLIPSWGKMAKATSIKDALKRWEEKHEQNAADATEVFLCFQWPPIEKMDNSLAILTNCTRLSLSTNMIEKIAGIASLKNLKILSLGRNYIKSFAGLEAVGDTLEELWISYNLIEKLKGINVLRNLKVLYMSNNLVREWVEFNKLQELPMLEDLSFVGNPLHESMEESAWRAEVPKRLPNLKKLDGEPVINEEVPQMVQPPGMTQTETEEEN